jgi:hypothetical protein
MLLLLASACQPKLNEDRETSVDALAPAASVQAPRVEALPEPVAVVIPSALAQASASPPAKPLPLTTAFRRELPTLGKPAATVFERFSMSSGAWGHAGRSSGLIIDVNGVVWSYREREDQRESFRLGTVPASDLGRMRREAALAVRGPIVALGADCKDCGYHGARVFLVPGSKDSLSLTSSGEHGGKAREKHLDVVIPWLAAIGTLALPVKRPRPFGLQVPLLTDLRHRVGSKREPGEIVFEWREHVTGVARGVRLDQAGHVFRFSWRHGKESLRHVGSVNPDSVQRLLRQARASSAQSWRDVDGPRVCQTIRWFGAEGTEATLISNDCEYGGKRSGAMADALIAWLTALDEQALPVLEPGWQG